jgi:hypothetical protein
MNEMMKTGAIAGGAVVLAVIAASMGPREIKIDLFSDQGEVFFKDFGDPAAAAYLEVTEFNAEKAEARKFAVQRDSAGRWTIPSHGNYPADAKDRMGKAAALLIGLKKEAVRQRPHRGPRRLRRRRSARCRHRDQGAAARASRMKDSAGNALADLMIGKEVEKQDARCATCAIRATSASTPPSSTARCRRSSPTGSRPTC